MYDYCGDEFLFLRVKKVIIFRSFKKNKLLKNRNGKNNPVTRRQNVRWGKNMNFARPNQPDMWNNIWEAYFGCPKQDVKGSIKNFFTVEKKAVKYIQILKCLEAIKEPKLQQWLECLYEGLGKIAKELREFAEVDDEWSITSAEECGRFLSFAENFELEEVREKAEERVEMLLNLAKKFLKD